MSELKASNPKDAIGCKKVAFSVLPWRVLHGVALAMLEGACKYGRHNYRAVGVRASIYFDACVGRHLSQWWEGEDIDADSGLHHIDKAIACLMVMRDSILQGNFEDDRPIRGGLDLGAANEKAAAIIEQHKDKSPKHYTIKDGVLPKAWLDKYTISAEEAEKIRLQREFPPGVVIRPIRPAVAPGTDPDPQYWVYRPTAGGAESGVFAGQINVDASKTDDSTVMMLWKAKTPDGASAEELKEIGDCALKTLQRLPDLNGFIGAKPVKRFGAFALTEFAEKLEGWKNDNAPFPELKKD